MEHFDFTEATDEQSKRIENLFKVREFVETILPEPEIQTENIKKSQIKSSSEMGGYTEPSIVKEIFRTLGIALFLYFIYWLTQHLPYYL
jgi:hypothetical protein